MQDILLLNCKSFISKTWCIGLAIGLLDFEHCTSDQPVSQVVHERVGKSAVSKWSWKIRKMRTQGAGHDKIEEQSQRQAFKLDDYKDVRAAQT